MFTTVKVSPPVCPLSLRPSACFVLPHDLWFVRHLYHDLLFQIHYKIWHNTLANKGNTIKMGMKVIGWMLTAVVEYTSKEGISHAEYRTALIHYTLLSNHTLNTL